MLSDRLGEIPEVRKCKQCGNQYEIKTTNGIRSLFKNYEEKLTYGYKECRDLRVKLQHGYGDLEDVITIVTQCADSCRIILLKGLFELLGIEDFIVGRYPNPVYNLNNKNCLKQGGAYLYG